MKTLQATRRPGYRNARLVMHEEYGVPYIGDTGEIPDGVDFMMFWQGAWREGRCYMDGGGNLTFVTYGDAVRIDLDEQIDEGIDIRLPLYLLTAEQCLDLARTYTRELGYTTVQDCPILSMPSMFDARFMRVAVSVGEPQPLIITITLSSWGDIYLVADREIRHTALPSDEMAGR